MGSGLSLHIRSICNLKFEHFRGYQFQVARFHKGEYREHHLRFDVDARLPAVIQWPLQTTAIEIYAHTLILVSDRCMSPFFSLSFDDKPGRITTSPALDRKAAVRN